MARRLDLRVYGDVYVPVKPKRGRYVHAAIWGGFYTRWVLCGTDLRTGNPVDEPVTCPSCIKELCTIRDGANTLLNEEEAAR